MRNQSGFSLPIILAVAAVVLVGGGVLAFLYVTNNTNPALESSAFTPQQPLNIPKPDTEVGFKTATRAATRAAPATSNQPLATRTISTGQMDTATTLSTDKKTFTLDFKSSTKFAGITTISYTLAYTSDAGDRGVSGTITVANETMITTASGQTIEKIITLGTCSATCTYDANPRNFHLSVSPK